jgi:hypothetical protein
MAGLIKRIGDKKPALRAFFILVAGAGFNQTRAIRIEV